MHAYARMHTCIKKCFPKRLVSWAFALKSLFSLTISCHPGWALSYHTIGNSRISRPNYHKKRANPEADPCNIITSIRPNIDVFSDPIDHASDLFPTHVTHDIADLGCR